VPGDERRSRRFEGWEIATDERSEHWDDTRELRSAVEHDGTHRTTSQCTEFGKPHACERRRYARETKPRDELGGTFGGRLEDIARLELRLARLELIQR
jgi:hypothetical protein